MKNVFTQTIYIIEKLPLIGLLFLMLFFPTVLQVVKLPLIFLIFFYILIVFFVKDKSFFISKELLFLFLLNILTGIAFIIYGVIRGNPGALRVLTIYVIYPFLYFFLIINIRKEAVFYIIFKTLNISALLISLYCIWTIGYFFGIIPFYIILPLEQILTVVDGRPEFTILSLSSLVFLTPFTLAVILSRIYKNPYIIILSFILQLVVTIISGRKALLLIVFFSFLQILYFKKYKVTLRGLSIIFVTFILISFIVVGIANYLEIDLLAIFNDFILGFDFKSQTATGTYERKKQFDILIDGWLENPLFGYGHGAAASYRRSDEFPWAYELSYIALLYQIGLVGFLVHGISAIWVIYRLLKIRKVYIGVLNEYILPTVVATIGFLIANATNPYLSKFDFIWIIFLPIALLNTIEFKIRNGIKN